MTWSLAAAESLSGDSGHLRIGGASLPRPETTPVSRRQPLAADQRDAVDLDSSAPGQGPDRQGATSHAREGRDTENAATGGAGCA